MTFNGFTKEGTAFLKKLEKNNSKVWFEDNRHIWEQTILTPNKAFIEDMGETLQILVPPLPRLAIPTPTGHEQERKDCHTTGNDARGQLHYSACVRLARKLIINNR